MGKRLLYFLILVTSFAGLLGAAPLHAANAQSSAPTALLMKADGALSPAMLEYLKRGINSAEKSGAELIIFQLNTPGGSTDLMTQMVEAIRGSTVPVVVYVAPRGAMAGSAGSIITLAGHVAAMAPETAIGAASPVDANGQDLGQTMQAKLKNMYSAEVRTLAERRGEVAVKMAQDMIENAKAVSSSEALQAGLVDFIAPDVPSLLRQMDGFQVQMENGEITLHTTGITVQDYPQSFIENLLAALTDPNIVLLLINIGVAAILIEISSPGGWIAGFVGVVCLALATYGLGVLPVNWFGLIFLALAFVLFILDIKAPTHGALTAAGVASLIIGALVLFNTPNVPGEPRVSVPLVVISSLVTGGVFFSMVLFALRAQKIPVRMGQQAILGRVGTVSIDLNPRGQVKVNGEAWSAEVASSEEQLPTGTRIQVVGIDGLKLLVKRFE